jgi:hypothetical protein
MATQPSSGAALIAGRYAVDTAVPLAAGGGGLPSFLASDAKSVHHHLMAVQLQPGRPPPLEPLTTIARPADDDELPGVLAPLAHGPAPAPGGDQGYFLICPAPPGPALAPPGGGPPRPWSEQDLIGLLLRPAALALDRLNTLGVTHRGIRPDNLFHAGMGSAVVLGCAWAAPPASLQPAMYEPPYSAMCLPTGRGEGSIADDVYALGVTMLVLALGHNPLAALDEAAVIERKLALGTFEALVGNERLPASVTELARGMLAEDPDHRPPPALLADPAAARGRRLASRPARRALRPLDVGGIQAWNARTLAYAIARFPDTGAQLLRAGEVDQWLRRNLGDVGLAARVDEVVHLRGGADAARQGVAAPDAKFDPLVTLRAVVALDPLAPLCWRGTAFWPSGLGPALAEAQAMESPLLRQFEEIVSAEVIARWADLRSDRCDAGMLRMEGRQHRTWLRQRGSAGGTLRLCYGLNPLLPCASPLLAGQWVSRLTDLLPALESVAMRVDIRRTQPLDRDIVAFVAARSDTRLVSETDENSSPAAAALLPLRLLARLQEKLNAGKLPSLCLWLAQAGSAALDVWHGATRRAQVEQRLSALARNGELAPMLALLDDPAALEADRRAEQRAILEVQKIDKELARLADELAGNATSAQRLGKELCVGIGIVALVGAIGIVAL